MGHLKSIVLAMLVYGLGLFVLEVYLQGAEIVTPMKSHIDPHIGPVFKPFTEGFLLGEINDQGYVGPSVPQVGSPDERRILLIGDSFVLAQQLFLRDHFGTLMAEDLSADDAERVQVLNFSQGDFNLSDLYRYSEDFASRWDHDLVLFFVDDTDLHTTSHVNTELYPHCVMAGDSLIIDRSFAESAAYRRYKIFEPLAERSALVRMALIGRQTILVGGGADMFLGKFAALLAQPDDSGSVTASPERPAGVTPLERGILKALAGNPRVVVVLKREIGVVDRKLMDELGLVVWDLQPTLDDMKVSGEDPYYWRVTGLRGHWNHAAHERIAEYLADRVREHPRWRDSVVPIMGGKAQERLGAL